MDERRIRFEVCSVKPWKATGVEEPVCEAKDGLPGGRENIEVFCDAAPFSNLASARFSIAEFKSGFLHLAWKEELFCLNYFADTPSSNLLMVANSFSPYAVLECAKCKTLA